MGEKPPLYFNRREYSRVADYGWWLWLIDISFSDVKQHAKLNPILNQIEKNRIPICCGADNELYYTIGFQIHAVYYSAHCEYMLWYEGRNYGSVKAEYVWPLTFMRFTLDIILPPYLSDKN